VNWERDCNYAEVADLRNVVEGDPSPDGQGKLRSSAASRSATSSSWAKYSEALGASVLDDAGKPERTMRWVATASACRASVAAAIEQNHDAVRHHLAGRHRAVHRGAACR
jgi:prolyl-tRNA synthetase